MLRFAVLFGGGVLLFQQLPVLPAPGWVLATALISLLLVRWRKARWTVGLLTGLAWSYLFALSSEPPAVPAVEAGPVAFLATGTVVGLRRLRPVSPGCQLRGRWITRELPFRFY